MGGVPVLELPLSELWCEEDLSRHANPETVPSYGLNFTVFEPLKFPTNASIKTELTVGDESRSPQMWGCWQFEAAGCDFELLPHPNYTEIRVNSSLSDAFAKCAEFPERVLDALFWVLGKPVYPATRLLHQCHTLRRTIYSRRTTFPEARHRAPLLPKHHSKPHADLVDAYLRFVLAHDNPRFVWAQLNAVYKASAARFTDAWALTLSVVIESFVNSEFEHLATPSDLEKEWVEEAIAHLYSWKPPAQFAALDARFKERAKGSLSGLKQARINDRLRALQDAKAIAPGATKAWTKIRNGTAHEYQGGAIKFDEFRAHLAALQVLFNHIFFHAMGYRGPYCDHNSSQPPVATKRKQTRSKNRRQKKI